MNETLSSTAHLGETRLMERALIIDAVCEAIAEYGHAAFAKSVPESALMQTEALVD